MKYSCYQTRGGSIPYVRVGKGPIIFLLIGFHSDVDRFRHVISHFSKHFTVIAPEYPGIGCKTTLQGKPYRTEQYAKLFSRMIKELKLSSYTLAGMCYGGIVALQMVKQGIRPTKLILIETFTSDTMVKLYPYQKTLLPFIHFALINTFIRKFFHMLMKSKYWMSILFHLIFFHEKDRARIVAYQVHLTTMMNPDCYLDAAREMLHFSIFTSRRLWHVPVIIICFQNDPQLDTTAALADIRPHFPNNKTIVVPYDEHIPSGPMSKDEVQKIFGPVLRALVTYI